MSEVFGDKPIPLETLRTMLAQSLQRTLQAVGPVPDIHGATIRRIFKCGDHLDMVMLGTALDECYKDKSYAALDELPK